MLGEQLKPRSWAAKHMLQVEVCLAFKMRLGRLASEYGSRWMQTAVLEHVEVVRLLAGEPALAAEVAESRSCHVMVEFDCQAWLCALGARVGGLPI